MSSEELEAALDGLQNAAAYARSINEHEIESEVESLYQRVGRVAPNEDWQNGLCVAGAFSHAHFERLKESKYITVHDHHSMGKMAEFDVYVSFEVDP